MVEISWLLLHIVAWFLLAIAALIGVTATINAHRNHIPFTAALADTVRAFVTMVCR